MEHAADPKIGIMSDSHGQPDAIVAALDFFNRQRCSGCYHLGDICDSLNVETLAQCVGILRENHVIALKGNNDHAQAVLRYERSGPADLDASLEYLDNLPLRVSDQGAVFAHSLPFVEEMGLSAMKGALDDTVVSQVLNRFPEQVLFRGHSHTPEIRWRKADTFFFNILKPGQIVNLGQRLPCIVTCGALTRRLCMVWQPGSMTVSCHSV